MIRECVSSWASSILLITADHSKAVFMFSSSLSVVFFSSFIFVFFFSTKCIPFCFVVFFIRLCVRLSTNFCFAKSFDLTKPSQVTLEGLWSPFCFVAFPEEFHF